MRIERALDEYGGTWLDSSAVRTDWKQYCEARVDNSFFVWQWISMGLMADLQINSASTEEHGTSERDLVVTTSTCRIFFLKTCHRIQRPSSRRGARKTCRCASPTQDIAPPTLRERTELPFVDSSLTVYLVKIVPLVSERSLYSATS